MRKKKLTEKVLMIELHQQINYKIMENISFISTNIIRMLVFNKKWYKSIIFKKCLASSSS